MVKHCAKNDTFQLFSFHLFYFASIYNVLSQKYADEQAIEPIQAIQLRKIWLISLIKLDFQLVFGLQMFSFPLVGKNKI